MLNWHLGSDDDDDDDGDDEDDMVAPPEYRSVNAICSQLKTLVSAREHYEPGTAPIAKYDPKTLHNTTGGRCIIMIIYLIDERACANGGTVLRYVGAR